MIFSLVTSRFYCFRLFYTNMTTNSSISALQTLKGSVTFKNVRELNGRHTVTVEVSCLLRFFPFMPYYFNHEHTTYLPKGMFYSTMLWLFSKQKCFLIFYVTMQERRFRRQTSSFYPLIYEISLSNFVR